jgi:hypothetical protein
MTTPFAPSATPATIDAVRRALDHLGETSLHVTVAAGSASYEPGPLRLWAIAPTAHDDATPMPCGWLDLTVVEVGDAAPPSAASPLSDAASPSAASPLSDAIADALKAAMAAHSRAILPHIWLSPETGGAPCTLLVRPAPRGALAAPAPGPTTSRAILNHAFGYGHGVHAASIASFLKFRQAATGPISSGTPSLLTTGSFWHRVTDTAMEIFNWHQKYAGKHQRPATGPAWDAYQSACAALRVRARGCANAIVYTGQTNAHSVEQLTITEPDYALEADMAAAWEAIEPLHLAAAGYAMNGCPDCRQGRLRLRYHTGGGAWSPFLACSKRVAEFPPDMYMGPR